MAAARTAASARSSSSAAKALWRTVRQRFYLARQRFLTLHYEIERLAVTRA
jgi:hypothetical protein